MTYWNSMCAYACIHADTRYKINFRDCSPWNRVQMIEEWSSLICAGIVLYQIWHSGSRNYDNFLFYCFYAKIFIFPCSSENGFLGVWETLKMCPWEENWFFYKNPGLSTGHFIFTFASLEQQLGVVCALSWHYWYGSITNMLTEEMVPEDGLWNAQQSKSVIDRMVYGTESL